MKHDRVTLWRAAAIRDAAGTAARPGVVAVRDGRIVAAGSPGDIPADLARAARVVDLPDRLLLPALVNAHAHLELTSVGCQPHPGSFTAWVAMLLERRPRTPQAVGESVRRGAAMSRQAGVAVVGDIGGGAGVDQAVLNAWAESGLAGVLFGEFLGYDGPGLDRELDRLDMWRRQQRPAARVTLGLQPHAPYSTSPDLYEACLAAAAADAAPVSTHLAETLEEATFVAGGDGPLRAFLAELGVWQPRHARWYDRGLSPVQWMRPHLERAPWLLAHCNYVSDDDIAILARTGASVAYCPVASEYFGHRDHRYRDMLAAGVNVCLGTDSILCQPPDQPQPLSILAQMRRLHRRDRFDPDELLAMATTRAMQGLQAPPQHATLTPGAPARFCTVPITQDPTDPLLQALLNDEPGTGEPKMNVDGTTALRPIMEPQINTDKLR